MTLQSQDRDPAKKTLSQFFIPGGKLSDQLTLFFNDCTDDENGENIPPSKCHLRGC